jgi:hypothetical protein
MHSRSDDGEPCLGAANPEVCYLLFNCYRYDVCVKVGYLRASRCGREPGPRATTTQSTYGDAFGSRIATGLDEREDRYATIDRHGARADACL